MRSGKESIAEITARYEEMLANLKDTNNSLKEQINLLTGENKQYKEREKKVLDALIAARQKNDEIQEVAQKTSLAEYNRLQLIAHKCERIAQRISSKYPNEDEVAKFVDFTKKINDIFVRVNDENFTQQTLLREGALQAVEIECGNFEPKKIINNYVNEETQDKEKFDMNEVLNPDKSKLDLKDLCKELGVSD